MPRAEVLALFGPTAVGKSALAHAAARELEGEIIVADPFQRYRGLEIAADAPGERERAEVPYHFVGDLDLRQASSAGEFADSADQRVGDILERGRVPIVAGGSGLYVRLALAVIDVARPVPPELRQDVEALVATDPDAARAELGRRDPDALEATEAENPRRLSRALELARTGQERTGELWSAPNRRPTHLVGVTRPRVHLYELIASLRDGLVAELEQALSTPGFSREAAQIIGVKEVRQIHEGNLGLEDLPARLTARTKVLARRQLTWLRRLDLNQSLDLGTSRDPAEHLPALVAAWQATSP